jgi:hypothetical protein
MVLRNLSLLAHTSLDGFVAGAKGELDDFDVSEENLLFVCSLTEQADAALFGRTSYELLNNYWCERSSHCLHGNGRLLQLVQRCKENCHFRIDDSRKFEQHDNHQG